MYNGQYIQMVNRSSRQANLNKKDVLDVYQGKDKEGNMVTMYNRHNGANQKWKILYLDEKEEDPSKGLDEDSGLYRNRPFYLVSRLPKHRVLTCKVRGTMGIQDKKKGNKKQEWYFDHLTRTVKSMAYTGQSLSIEARTNPNNSQTNIEKTDARWW